MRQSWKVSFRADNERAGAGEAGEDGRPCARGQWCASATRTRLDDGTTERTPPSGPRAFCGADEAIIGDVLRRFPDTWKRLWPHLLTHLTAEISVRVPFGPSVPIRTDADTILRALVDCALTWHERVAAVDPTLSAPGGAEGTSGLGGWGSLALGRHAPVLLEESARRLGERVTVLLALEPEPMMRPLLVGALGCGEPHAAFGDCVLLTAGGAHAGGEVLKLDYLAQSAMGETNPDLDQILGVECEQCGHKSLRRALPPMHEGETAYAASCDDCHALYTDEELSAWTARLTRFYARLVTPAALRLAGLRGDETPAIAAASAA